MKAFIHLRVGDEPIDRRMPKMELNNGTPEAIRKFVWSHQNDVFDTETLGEAFLVVDRREVLVFLVYNEITILIPHHSLRTARLYVRRYLEIA